jgi:hypothetical protein
VNVFFDLRVFERNNGALQEPIIEFGNFRGLIKHRKMSTAL